MSRTSAALGQEGGGLQLAGQGLRFVLGGAVNSLATYGLYWVLLTIVPYTLAYTLAYVAGISLAYVMNSVWVFNRRLRWRVAAGYPVVYLGQYCLGLVILYLCVDTFHLPERFAPLVVIAVTVPATFLINREIFRRITAPPLGGAVSPLLSRDGSRSRLEDGGDGDTRNGHEPPPAPARDIRR